MIPDNYSQDQQQMLLQSQNDNLRQQNIEITKDIMSERVEKDILFSNEQTSLNIDDVRQINQQFDQEEEEQHVVMKNSSDSSEEEDDQAKKVPPQRQLSAIPEVSQEAVY